MEGVRRKGENGPRTGVIKGRIDVEKTLGNAFIKSKKLSTFGGGKLHPKIETGG